jgi:uncharacterized alpha-E superfamily protein
MISRVAESCFWLTRHMERADNMARLLGVNRSFLLDTDLPQLEQWMPVVVVSGEQERFTERLPKGAENDAEAVQEYLVWDPRCPVGIRQSLYWARENARMIREVISLEMWESANEFWHWLKGGPGRRLYNRDRDAFYKRIKDAVAQFEGTMQHTMLHDEPFDFMRLGVLLERANQTARIVDVKYHLLGPTQADAVDTPVEAAQWAALLRSCSAEESFWKRGDAMTGPFVADFLMHEREFPRAIYYCLDRALRYLKHVHAATQRGDSCVEQLTALVQSLERRSIDRVLSGGLHQELTRVINETMDICSAIARDYLDPSFNATLEVPAETDDEPRRKQSGAVT